MNFIKESIQIKELPFKGLEKTSGHNVEDILEALGDLPCNYTFERKLECLFNIDNSIMSHYIITHPDDRKLVKARLQAFVPEGKNLNDLEKCFWPFSDVYLTFEAKYKMTDKFEINSLTGAYDFEKGELIERTLVREAKYLYGIEDHEFLRQAHESKQGK